MTKNDDKRVPALRFKGFNDDWAQRKLGDYITVNKIKNKENNHFIPYSISNKWGFIPQEKQFGEGNTYSKTNKATNYIVEPNTFAYNPARINVGSIAYQNNQFPVIVSSLYEIFKAKKNLNDEFLMNWFKTEKFTRQIQKLQEGGVRQYFFIDKMQESRITIPFISEQEEISKTLNQISNLIKLQQRKLQQLKLLKKAMLQDLFTDKNVPKLRFNGFDANWIQCKLEKEALLTMGQSPSGSTYSDQPSTYILVQGNADLKNGWVKPRIWTTQITKLAKKGDIIITVRAPAGKVGRTNFDVVLGRGVASIQGNDFIFYLLSKMDINKYWKKYAAGSTFESINSNDIKNTRVHVPNLSEQNRIANLFLRLDDLIRFQQNKLNNLQKTKQFLLQNMFI